MSASKFPLLMFVVVLLALIGGIFLLSTMKAKKLVTAENKNTVSQTISVTPVPTSALSTGTSNTQLDHDSTQIDNSLDSFTNDATSVDQGLNDQETNLQ